jgi:hypothetical protein
MRYREQTEISTSGPLGIVRLWETFDQFDPRNINAEPSAENLCGDQQI